MFLHHITALHHVSRYTITYIESHRAVGVQGIEYILPENDSIISDSIRMFGHYELGFILLFRDIHNLYIQLARRTDPFVFVDVGANIGSWSLFLAKYLDKLGYVYSIEAQHKLLKYLGASAILNGFNNIQTNNFIVSNESNKYTFLYDIDSSRETRVNHGEYSVFLLQNAINKDRTEAFRKGSKNGRSVRHITLGTCLL